MIRPTPLPAAQPLHRRARHGHGFSLVELLIGVLIGVLISTILVGAAVKALLALIQDDAFTQQELNRKDDTSRVLSLLQDEIRSARRVDSGGSLSALSGCTTTPQLILRGATAKESISYGLKVQPSSSSWRGPNVLVRCGPPYNADGSLNAGTDQTPNRSEQEVLDALQANGFTASTPGTSVNRSVELTLISNAASNVAVTSQVQVPINVNQVYGLSTTGDTSCSSGCDTPDGAATHWQPSDASASTINGAASKEDVIYFNGRKDEYTLSGSTGRCLNNDNTNSGNCTVVKTGTAATITINSGNVLVFSDAQIRLPNS
jgi:Tfp pilus assembly protein PilW